MGLIVPNAMHPEHDEQPMPYDWFVGIDWGSQQHQVCVLTGSIMVHHPFTHPTTVAVEHTDLMLL